MADVKYRRFDRSALTRYVFDLGHSIDWQHLKVLEFECDFHKRRFIESYYINTDQSSMNDKSSDMFPDIYRFLMSKQWRLLLCSVYGLPTVSVVLLLIQFSSVLLSIVHWLFFSVIPLHANFVVALIATPLQFIRSSDSALLMIIPKA